MWSKEAPKLLGHYWARFSNSPLVDKPPFVAHKMRYGWMIPCEYKEMTVSEIREQRGEIEFWSVPIPPPTEAADADKS